GQSIRESTFGQNGRQGQYKIFKNRDNGCVTLAQVQHNDLLYLMAERPRCDLLWREFLKRFARLITVLLLAECNRLNYKEGRKNVNDLRQEVYVKLLRNDGKAFKAFKGRYYHSTFAYLKIISSNVVRNDLAKKKQKKRLQEADTIYLDKKRLISEKQKTDLHEIISDVSWHTKIHKEELIDEIEYTLQRIINKRSHAERDKLIFRYHFYAGFHAHEIARLHVFGLSAKRIGNIISAIKDSLRCYLRRCR
ncbi:MAG: hypothetical protein ACE5I1_12220, partial [bacterium]